MLILNAAGAKGRGITMKVKKRTRRLRFAIVLSNIVVVCILIACQTCHAEAYKVLLRHYCYIERGQHRVEVYEPLPASEWKWAMPDIILIGSTVYEVVLVYEGGA